MRVFLMAALAAFIISGTAVAEDEIVNEGGAERVAESTSEPAMKKSDNPHLITINETAQELAQELTTEEAQRLNVVRENFGILRSIDVARNSVEEATKLCAEKNPDLSEKITARHKTWHSEIGKALDAQEKQLEESISSKNFAEPKKIEGYLDTIDRAAKHADENIEKKSVTTPEACTNLMNSMDNTQEVILGLVTALSWPQDMSTDSKEN